MSWTRTSGSHALLSSKAQAARLALLIMHWIQYFLFITIINKKCDIQIMLENGYFLPSQVPQDVLQKLLETLQENHYQEDEQFLGAVMPRLGNYDLHIAL